ncbi:uncharacterized protein MONOS_3956 [Monocercomonoides exilis]|uniref:uncharacterized protein n=1 Tax=Monocercomonoides exilis TaxID=2049356 RepID=UPI00355A861E|nr:hypothetical protein MONOS_3956 [Monocercomonoides exilis]|eukprot:MONOS_3956.1-p1 / transcript=MONOS_3956.1 / gene=MONOS_3956 / organism=Monocercomonoides_exilis_PA203 / gene_product=unspecified product / transcript_product=unspecified product / location=Mono_scaffold00099:3368-6126(+) / protein_length=513 / sequence_SO=supercontig / SO=protein_coding / is_pseudo=false
MVGIIRDAVIGNNWIVTNSFWASDGTLCFNLRHESGSNPDAFKRAFPAACVYLRAKRGKKLPSPNIFTIASSPMDEGVQLLAYRRGGSFTTDMDFLVQEGITVKLEGPYSTFTPQLDETGEALIIASEIGIGALMAILRHAVKMYHLKKLKKRIRIIFYCKNPRCIIFPEEVKYLVNTLAKNEAEVYYSPATHRNELVYGPATPSVSSVTASRVGGGRPAAIPLQTIPSSSFSLHPSSTLSLNGDSDAMQVPEYTGTNTVTSRREKTGRGKEKKGKMSAKRRETLSDDADRKLRLKSIDTSADSGDGTAEEESDRSNSSTSATASSSSALYGNGKGSYRHSARLDSYTSLAHSSNESESDETEGAQKRQSKMLSTPLSLRMSPYSSSSSSYSSLTPARNHLSTAVLPEPRRIKKKIRQTHKLSCIRFAYLFHDFGALDELKQNEHMKEWIPLHGMGLCFEGDISTPLFEKMIDDASKVSVYTYGAFKKADTILKHPPFNISFNRIISSAYEI